jgi:transcriptional regulator with XRE-family HTH domain
MDIKISENLKKFRKQKGNTQQELADHLGISMQAVSKWECGEGFPDITLIPAIALYYNVTTDDLFGMSEEIVEAKIKEYEAKALEISQTNFNDWIENQIKQIALWREALKEFPNNHKVLMNLFFWLSVPLLAPRTIEHFDEIVQIGERLLAESTDNDTRFRTIQILCDVYANEKDFESAKKYADMLPTFYAGKEIVYGRCLTGEERIKYRQENIRDFIINGINGNFIQGMSGGNTPLEEVVKIYEFSYKLWHLLYSDGDFGCYEITIAGTCQNLANMHSGLGNTEEALFYLNETADHFVKADHYYKNYAPGKKFKHTSIMVNRLEDPENQAAKDAAQAAAAFCIQVIEDTKSFDRMRNDGRYIAAIETIKALSRGDDCAKYIKIAAKTYDKIKSEGGDLSAKEIFSNLRIGINKSNDLELAFDPLPNDYKAQFRELHFEARKTGETNWTYLNNMGMHVTDMSVTSLMNHEAEDWRDISDGEYELGIRSVAESLVREENHAIPPQKVAIAVSGEPVSDYAAAAKRPHYIFSGAHIQNDTLYCVELRTKEDKAYFLSTFRSEAKGSTLKMPMFPDGEGYPLSFARLRQAEVSGGGDYYTITYSPYNNVSVPVTK